MEVRIGMQHTPREIILEVTQSPEDVEKAVSKALGSSAATFTLVDEKGRRVVLATDKLAYVEIAEAEGRRVGFAAI